MKASELPKFITLGKKRPKKKPQPITARGDTGTPEMKRRMLEADIGNMTPIQFETYRTSKGAGMKVGVAIEARARASTGHETVVGGRVESQIPFDRYKARQELDPANSWRNGVLWEGGERLRKDFHASGLTARTCSSFEPRIKGGGDMQWEADTRVAALVRYKRAMNGISQTLRPVLFYVCIAGETAKDWAVRNAKAPQSGIEILRLALAELAHYYGFVRLKD